MLDNIRIVLVNTSHPGNIGAAARAIKNMGLSHLTLVGPKIYPSAIATERAAGADDILANAIVVDTLKEAIADCTLVIGTSARNRDIPLTPLNPKECAQTLKAEGANGKIAIVFGREASGLTNEELNHCHYQTYIPSNQDYSSLNLAAAVQVICYELRMAHQDHNEIFHKVTDELAPAEDVERFYTHLQQVLEEIHFLRPRSPKRLMERLRRLFTRIRLENMEVAILRGILSAIQYKEKEKY